MQHEKRIETDATASAEFIAPDDPRWSRALAEVEHDLYHLPEYAVLCAGHEGGEPAAFYAETACNRFLVPLLMKRVPFTGRLEPAGRDLISPYGYASPLVVGPDDGEMLGGFLETFRWVARELGCVTAFLRLHPLLPLSSPAMREYGRLVRHGETVSIDLTLSEERLWRQIRRDRRAGIRKLIRQGFRVVMDDWRGLDDFVRIYRETMQRVAAKEFYFFERDYFTGLQTRLGGRMHLCQVFSPGGRMAAGGLYSVVNGIVQLHLSGTANEYCRLGPSKLMIHEIALASRAAGARILHLGGGVGGRRDSLFEFKAAFSPQRHPYSTFRMVLMEERYREYCRLWKKEHGEGALSSDYFPLYRYSG